MNKTDETHNRRTISNGEARLIHTLLVMLNLNQIAHLKYLVFHYFWKVKRDKELNASMEASLEASLRSENKQSAELEFYELFLASSILVACKESSNERKCRDILNCLFYCIHQPHALEIDNMFWSLKDSLIRTEILLLRCLGFQTSVPDVFDEMAEIANQNQIHDRRVLQLTISILNSSAALDEVHELIDEGSHGVFLLAGTVLALSAKIVYPSALNKQLEPFLSETIKISSSQDTLKAMNLVSSLVKELDLHLE